MSLDLLTLKASCEPLRSVESDLPYLFALHPDGPAIADLADLHLAPDCRGNGDPRRDPARASTVASQRCAGHDERRAVREVDGVNTEITICRQYYADASTYWQVRLVIGTFVVGTGHDDYTEAVWFADMLKLALESAGATVRVGEVKSPFDRLPEYRPPSPELIAAIVAG